MAGSGSAASAIRRDNSSSDSCPAFCASTELPHKRGMRSPAVPPLKRDRRENVDPVIDDLPHQVALGKHAGWLCVSLIATQNAVRPISWELRGFSMLRALSLPLLAASLASSSGSAQEVAEAAREEMIAAIEDHARSAPGALKDGTMLISTRN